MSDDDHIRVDTRLAGQVRRYHTWPIVKEQSIAEHCWQLLRIYLSVVDKPDPYFIYHITFHDIGEHFTGDIPYPVKSENDTLKAQMDFLEHKSYCTQLEFWGAFRQALLTDADKVLFKQIELIEMAEFGLDQMCLGNHHGEPIANRCLRAVYENNPSARLVKYVIRRLILFDRQYPFELPEEVGQWWSIQGWEAIDEQSERESDWRQSLQDSI